MSKDGKPKADERAERLAAALKENLRRRKAQVRNRRDSETSDTGRNNSPAPNTDRTEGGSGDT